MDKTIADALARVDEERAEAVAKLDREAAILRMLPGDVICPTISNISETAYFGEPGYWLTFNPTTSRSYVEDPDTVTGSAILAAIEAAGFKPEPATLCRWDNWRRSPEPGLAGKLPEEKGRYKLTDENAICPVWVKAQLFSGHHQIRARAFYRDPAGAIARVGVPGPAGPRVSANRRETKGDWYYEVGTTRFNFPNDWHTILDADEQPCAIVGSHTKTFRDTEKSVSGVVYWEPIAHEQADFPLTPATFLDQIEKDAQP